MTKSSFSLQATQIVEQFLRTLIRQKLMPSIQKVIREQFIHHKILTQGAQQNTKNFFPKILTELQAQNNGHSIIYTQEAHLQPFLSSKKSLKRTFRKSCDDMREVHQLQTHLNNDKRPFWLKGYRQSQEQIAQFNRLISQKQKQKAKNIQSKKKKIFLKQINNINPKRHQRKSSILTLAKQQDLNDSQLIKLQQCEQKQDQQIVKKREHLLKLKLLEKDCQINIFTMSTESHSIALKKQDPLILKEMSKPFVSFTTDYDGQIIEFSSDNNKNMYGLKKYTANGKRFGEKYSTVTNSPSKSKVSLQATSKANFNEKKFVFQDQTYLKEQLKIKFKVKKQTYVQSAYPPQSKVIQFNMRDSKFKKVKSPTQLSERTTCSKLTNERLHIKSSRQMIQTLDEKTLLKDLQLSPGVMIDDFSKIDLDDKENTMASVKLMTKKSIGRSKKNLGSQVCIPSMKSIMMSRKV